MGLAPSSRLLRGLPRNMRSPQNSYIRISSPCWQTCCRFTPLKRSPSPMVRADKLRYLPERFPVACQWEITCRCNLRCVMCYTDCFNRPNFIRQELTTPEILRIMDELAEAGTLELCLTGGEPLARPDFFELYEHAVRSGFLVTVFTNGTLIAEADADRFAALRPYRLEISLHGATQETFERITQGRGAHDRCLQAVQLLLERNISLVLKTTAMTLNQHEV